MKQPMDAEQALPRSTPFGYKWQDGKFVPDDHEAAIRKLIYELFLRHRRKKTVARLLNEAGYRTRTGTLFSDTTIDRLLRDPSASGVYQLNQNRGSRSGKFKEISIEPIVSVDLWEQANAILKQEQKLGKTPVQLFAGLIYCHCGAKMSVPSNSPKYICANCRLKISTADIEAIFQEQLQSIPLSRATTENASLCDYWPKLTKEEKRLIVEQAVDRIIIGKNEIQIEFYQFNSFKMLADGQQMAKEQQEENELIEVMSAKEEEQTPLTLNEPLLNETDAAKFLGISRMTLLHKRNNNEIKFFRVGFRVLYSKEKHLLPFLTRCEKGTPKKSKGDS